MSRTAFLSALILGSACGAQTQSGQIPGQTSAHTQSGQTQSGQTQTVWKTLRDGKCTLAVPDDWIVDEDMPDPSKVQHSGIHGGNGPATEASIMELPVGPNKPTFISLKDHLLKDALRAKAIHLQLYHHAEDVRVLENTPTRFILMTVTPDKGDGQGDVDWLLLAAGNPICKARVYAGDAFANAGPEMRAAAQQLRAVAAKIVTTFTSAK